MMMMTMRRNHSSWRMVLASMLCCALLATTAHAKKSYKGERVITVEEVSLGVDPSDNFQGESTIDIYNYVELNGGSRGLKAKTHKAKSHKSEEMDGDKPLVVFACGGNVPKSAYRTFAEGLAKKDLVVAIIEHNVAFGGNVGNYAIPTDIVNAVAYMEENSDLYGVDTDQVVLLGHSFGTAIVLNLINNNCPFPFCQDPASPFPAGVTIERPAGVVLAGGFGSSFSDIQTGDFITYNNVDIPYIIINGNGDKLFLEPASGEDQLEGSFERMAPPKAVAAIDNIDHFSISEVNTEPTRSDIPSTLDLDEQIRIVTRSLYVWIRANLRAINKERALQDFCFKLKLDGMNKGYDIVKCLEEYPSS